MFETLTRIELDSHATITHPVPTEALPVQIFVGDGSLWLTTLDKFRVLRLRERLHFKDLESFLNDHLSTSPDRVLR